MIHLDTNYLIRSLVSGTPQAAQLDAWLSSGEYLGVSAIAWREFLCGPVSEAQTSVALAVFGSINPVTGEDGALAAELFNKSGRRRGTLADCIIAAVAIRSGALLATENRADFAPLVSAGLKLA